MLNFEWIIFKRGDFMFKRALISAAILAATASSAFATTTIGGATLIDTATVNSGTV